MDEDARSLGQFVSRYLTEQDRWNSPRYLLGESYGTTRSAALVNYLQSAYNMDFNGVTLISSVLDFQTITFDPGNLMPYAMDLPSYAAVAWYHHALPNPPTDLRPFLKEVEHFATTDYFHALLEGDEITPQERAPIVEHRLYRCDIRRERRCQSGGGREELRAPCPVRGALAMVAHRPWTLHARQVGPRAARL